MPNRTAFLGFVVFTAVVALWLSQGAHAKGDIGKQTSPTGKTDTVDTSKFAPKSPKALLYDDRMTLVRNRDYRAMGQTVDCPDCKDLFCADFRSPHPGAKIIGADFISMRSDGHWFRCQIQARCGLPEFSNPANPTLGCTDVDTCRICRAVNATFPDEDDIVVHSQ
jgi:hypothetical protein